MHKFMLIVAKIHVDFFFFKTNVGNKSKHFTVRAKAVCPVSKTCTFYCDFY